MLPDNDLDPKDIVDIAKAVPESAWIRFVETACNTVEKLLSPITELNAGIGRLIKAKFDRYEDVQKVYAADILAKAEEKVKKSRKARSAKVKAPILLTAMDEASYQTDATMRELWANLISQEIVSGDVHPEFVRILSRLTAEDAQLLVSIAEKYKNLRAKQLVEALVLSFRLVLLPPSIVRRRTFHHELLEQLHLIYQDEKTWYITKTGWSFIKAVTDPSDKEE